MIPYLIGMESFLPAMKVLRAAGRGLLPNKKNPGVRAKAALLKLHG